MTASLPDAPVCVSDIIDKVLQENPALRYQSVADLTRNLRAYTTTIAH